MNSETILREGIVIKPFEARLADEELRAKVRFFKKLLAQKSKQKSIGHIKIKLNVPK